MVATNRSNGGAQVFVMTTIMASASGLGALPFFFVGKLSVEWSALANAIACGVMLAASFDLVHEGGPYSAWYTITGVLLGAHLVVPSHPHALIQSCFMPPTEINGTFLQ